MSTAEQTADMQITDITPESYTVVHEQVTWVRWDPKAQRNRTSHPWVWTVRENGTDVKVRDTKAEAQAWIAAQF